MVQAVRAVRRHLFSALAEVAPPTTTTASSEDEAEVLEAAYIRAAEERKCINEMLQPILEGAKKALRRTSGGTPTCDTGHSLVAAIEDSPTCGRCGASAEGPTVVIACSEKKCRMTTCALTDRRAPVAMARAMRALSLKFDDRWASPAGDKPSGEEALHKKKNDHTGFEYGDKDLAHRPKRPKGFETDRERPA